MTKRIALLHSLAIGCSFADVESGEHREHGLAHAPRGRAQLGARRLDVNLMVDCSDILEAQPRQVRRHDHRSVELGPACAQLPDEESANRSSVCYNAFVGQTLHSPGKGNCARREEAVPELKNSEGLRNFAQSNLHEMRPDFAKCARRST
jgi:hypothetical protein